jgi:hypothetical protein
MKKIIFLLLLAFQFQAQTLNYLIVGAGGSSTNNFILQVAGSGGGGVIQNSLTATTGTFPVTVGLAVSGGNGQNSSALGFTAIGGGQGEYSDGDLYPPTVPSGGGLNAGAAGTAGQSFAGGNGSISGDGGGGGGAGAVGGNASIGVGGNGGAGITSTISGSSYVYGSGGGGYGATGGTGGTGAGNGGSVIGSIAGTSATNYGGGSGSGTSAQSGFQGVVILSYLTAQVTATGGTITTDGASTIHTFTSSGNFIVTAVSSGNNVSGIRIFFQN